jgi:hypothetical protein
VAPHGKAYARQKALERHELTPEADSHDFETAVELESGDEDGPVVVRRSAGFRGSMSPGSSPQRPAFSGQGQSQSQHQGQGEGGSQKSSGPDGYDAFENTNNKKKRKIPTPGNMGGHHSALSPEFASMGLANSYLLWKRQPCFTLEQWDLWFWSRSFGTKLNSQQQRAKPVVRECAECVDE